MHIVRLVLVFAIALALASCGKSNLSRSEAESAIEVATDLKAFQTKVPLHSGALQLGMDQGIWIVNSTGLNSSVVLSNKANEIVAVSLPGFLVMGTMTLKQPTSIAVTVTGISDVPGATNLKEALFTWSYDSLPPVPKRFASVGGSGHAVFQLFDDGWRLTTLAMQASDQAIALSADELRGAATDQATETERRRVLQAQQQEAAEKLAARIKVSQTPTRTIMVLTVEPNSYQRDASTSITLTDVGIIFGRADGQTSLYWFGDTIQITHPSTGTDLYLVSRHGGAGIVRVVDGADNGHNPNTPKRDAFEQAAQSALAEWRTRYGDLVQSPP